MRTSYRHYHVLPSVASFVSWTRRYEHSLHSTANGPAEERPENLCPRKECLTELVAFIMAAEAKGVEVILSIDANEATDSHHSALPEFLSHTTLVDTIAHAHGDMAPKTYLRGHRRIDFVFASESLLPHLRRSGPT